MAGVGFESKQTEDTAVTQVDYGPFRACYAYSRSYERVTGNRPSNDYLEWKSNDDRLVFAVCDGVESSHMGGSAARFLGHKLVEWLFELSDQDAEDLVQIKTSLDAALLEWMPAAQRVLRSKVKSGETVFTCGWVRAQPDGLRGFMAGSGLTYVRLYDRKGRDVTFTPVRHAYDRWSSVRGLRGQTYVHPLGPRPPLQRLMLFTDGLSELEDQLSRYSGVELQTAILESFHSVLNDDISLLDVQICDRPVGGKATKTILGAEEQEPVVLERIEDGLEWETRADTVYSVLESRVGERANVVSAGNFFNWRPSVETACEYRVCLVSPGGRAYSQWLVWEPISADPDRLADSTQVVEEITDPPSLAQVFAAPEPDEPVLAEDVEAEAAPDVSAVEEPEQDSELVDDLFPGAEAGEETSALAEEFTESSGIEGDEIEEPSVLETLAALEVPDVPPADTVFVIEPPMLEETPPEVEAVDGSEPAADGLPPQFVTAAPEEETPAEITAVTPIEVVEEKPGGWLQKLPSIGGLLQQARGLFKTRITFPRTADVNRTAEPRFEKGKYPGQYLLQWPATPGANEYEVWDQPTQENAKERFLRTSDTRMQMERFTPGLHIVHIRPLGEAFDPDWQTWPVTRLTVPTLLSTAPTGLRVETTEDEATLRLRWSSIPEEEVEEYWVFEIGREEHRLIGKVASDIRNFSIRKTSADRIRRFVVRGVNWAGLGPDSEPAVYQPGAAPASQNRITGRVDRRSQPLGSEQRLAQVPELCDAVNRWVKSQNVQMNAMKLEQRYENVDQYLLLENRKVSQLVTLPILKGPEYRLTIYGARGEVLVAEIRFEKRNWNFLVKYLTVLRRG